MLYRKAKKEIDLWMKESGNGLMVSGARQVGKTRLIRECLQNSGRDYLEINLIERPELIPLLDTSTSVQDLVINLSTAFDHEFIRNETIVFIDEVQELTDIVTKIKFWVDEGSFQYILSGSLLGIELRSLRSAPVGYLQEIKMYPMDFEEFLIASGIGDDTFEYLKDCFDNCEPVADLIHKKMLQLFRRYLVVGGMPQAVQEYVDSGDISRVSVIQSSIIELYKLDYTKYEKLEKKLRLISIYDQIPSQLLKQNRRFNYSDIQKGLRFERLEDSFLWLTSAGVTIPVYNTTEPKVALGQNTKSSLLKLYYSDTGLLTYKYGSNIRMHILSGEDKMNLGGIYENAVASELDSKGFPLFFYNSHKSGELDFVIEYNMSVVPIEVKSGKDYTVHSALNKVIWNDDYKIKEAYVLSNGNIKREGRIHYIPIYMTMFLGNYEELPILEPIVM